MPREIRKNQIDMLWELNIFDFINKAYEIVFGRTPDEAGMKEHINNFLRGLSKEEILYSFLISNEAEKKGIEAEEELITELKNRIVNKKDTREQSELQNVKDMCNTLVDYMVTYEKTGSLPRILNSGKDTYHSIDYFDFENHFRGSRDKIKDNQRIYVPYYEGCNNVLDLGCGRGEFTELLVENGIGVTGVDKYGPYVDFLKKNDLPVVEDDAIEYLRKQKTVDGIFLGQVIEHLKMDQVIEIFNLAKQRLQQGRYLIMETPNPMSLAIFSHAFYIDPSHEKPVHPLTLKYIAEKAGFKNVEIKYTESSKPPYSIPKLHEDEEEYREFNNMMNRVSDALFGSQDYALIAKQE